MRSGPAMMRSTASSNSDMKMDFLFSLAAKDGSFVDQVGQICTAEPRRFLGYGVKSDLRSQGLARSMHSSVWLCGLRKVRQVQCDPAVEPAGAKECRVQDVRTVRCGNDDDVGVGFESVHFY